MWPPHDGRRAYWRRRLATGTWTVTDHRPPVRAATHADSKRRIGDTTPASQDPSPRPASSGSRPRPRAAHPPACAPRAAIAHRRIQLRRQRHSCTFHPPPSTMSAPCCDLCRHWTARRTATQHAQHTAHTTSGAVRDGHKVNHESSIKDTSAADPIVRRRRSAGGGAELCADAVSMSTCAGVVPDPTHARIIRRSS